MLRISHLSSTRDSNGYTDPELSIRADWHYPVDNLPLGNIISKVYIQPESRYKEQRVFCHYYLEYEFDRDLFVFTYSGSDQYVPLNRWTTLAWDFTGIAWHQNQPWEDEWKTFSDSLSSNLHYHTSPMRKLGEQMLFSAVDELNNQESKDWEDNITSIGIRCQVSANKHFTTTSDTKFVGNLFISNIWVPTGILPWD